MSINDKNIIYEKLRALEEDINQRSLSIEHLFRELLTILNHNPLSF